MCGRPDADGQAVFGGLLSLLLADSAARPEADEEVAECVQDLKDVVWRALRYSDEGRWSLKTFGSAVSGFGTRCSDLDVSVCLDPAGRARDCDRAAEVLRQLRREVSRSDRSLFEVKYAVLRARVPVLKLRYRGYLDVDVSAQNDGAVRNTRLLKAYADIGGRPVAELGVAVKLWARSCGLCGADAGHLSSYALVLMAIYFLQVAHEDRLPCLQGANGTDADVDKALQSVKAWCSRCTVAALLCQLFCFYAEEFDWGREVVSVRIGCRRSASDPEFAALTDREADRLHIEDPYDLQRNLRDVLAPLHEQDLRLAFQVAAKAVRAGCPLEAFPLLAECTRSPLRVGSKAVARRDDAVPPGAGYLPLRAGDCVEVLHLGAEADSEDRGWAFVETAAEWGWVRQEALISGPAPRAPPAVAPPPVVSLPAAPSPILRAPPPTRGFPAPLKVLLAGSIVVATANAVLRPRQRHAGYLVLVKGDKARVLYVGTAETGDAGWVFGSSARGQGWFSADVVSPCREGPGGDPDVSEDACHLLTNRFPQLNELEPLSF